MGFQLLNESMRYMYNYAIWPCCMRELCIFYKCVHNSWKFVSSFVQPRHGVVSFTYLIQCSQGVKTCGSGYSSICSIFWALTYYMYVYCNRLPCRTYGEEASNADSTCHICMSDFEAGQRVRTLTCFHEYHSTCIDQWLQVCMVLLYYIHRF